MSAMLLSVVIVPRSLPRSTSRRPAECAGQRTPRGGLCSRMSLLFILVIHSGCSGSHTTEDGGRHPRDSSFPRVDGATVEPPPGVVICGAAACADGEECCLRTLSCFDPSDASACTVLPEETDPDACASNSDCGLGELCEAYDIFSDEPRSAACGGLVGRCVMQRGTEVCGGFGDGVCGCDGRTYTDPCAASRSGVRVSWLVPCGSSTTGVVGPECDAEHPFCMLRYHCDFALGRCMEDRPVIACGIDAQCPSDSFCCEYVGACMPADRQEACFAPPMGTWFPCLTNEDCEIRGTDPVGSWYCAGSGCGTPGGCTYRERDCGGEVVPVCGCDGMTYTNSCWASTTAIRVAYEGECN